MLGESCINVDDPDAIWRRKHNGGPLIFGKINPMGDYRSELGFHPDTLKKKGRRRKCFMWLLLLLLLLARVNSFGRQSVLRSSRKCSNAD